MYVCTYDHLHKTLFFLTPIQSLYFTFPYAASSSSGLLFHAPRVSAYESFHCNKKTQCRIKGRGPGTRPHPLYF